MLQMDNKQPILILRTAFNASKFLNSDISPVSTGKARTDQYLNGLIALEQHLPNFKYIDKFLIDNTIESENDLPFEYRNILNTKIILTNTNKYGKYNKGAGDVETAKHLMQHKLLPETFYFMYEPRLKLINGQFINSFFSNPRNMICAPKNENSTRSGYYGIHYEELILFLKANSPFAMKWKKTSIEDKLLIHANKNNWEIWETFGYCQRFHPELGRYLPY